MSLAVLPGLLQEESQPDTKPTLRELRLRDLEAVCEQAERGYREFLAAETAADLAGAGHNVTAELGDNVTSGIREVTLPAAAAEDPRARRYRLQEAAAELLPGERVAKCLRVPHGSTVDLVHHAHSSTASFGGLQTCGSVWHCPVCCAKVTEKRREQLREAVQRWEDRGGRVVMVTYTLRHQKGEGLADVLEGLKAARRSVRSGRAAKRFAERYGVAGSIRALEVTLGAAGWHPHLHELLFVPADCDLPELQQDLRARWTAAVLGAGRSANRHGLKVSFNLTAAEYVAKFGEERTWTGSEELTKSASKVAKPGSKGRNPVQLLAAWADGQDLDAARDWLEYARTMKGQRQLFWSHGLAELLDMADEVNASDEELAEEETEKGRLLVQLQGAAWVQVLRVKGRAALLDVASRGSAAEVLAFLDGLGVPPGLAWEPLPGGNLEGE